MATVKKPKKVVKPKVVEQQTDDFEMLSDRDHVRRRPGMYIPNKDYCVYELVDNGVDILINNKNSHLYKTKLITLNINTEGIVTVTDSAGALPIREDDKVPGHTVAELCVSRLKAGTKFKEGVKSAGLNGVGASCINFLSEWFKVEICTDGKLYDMMFKEGVIEQKLEEKGETEITHTLMQCKPDHKIWHDKDDFNINAINNRMKQICYLNPGLTIQVDIDYNGANIHETYNYPEGVKSYVEELIEDKQAINDIWLLNKSTELPNGKTCEISLAFVYTETYSDTVYAFTNNVLNTDGKSSNITGFKRGLAAAVKECFEAENPKSKISLTAEDTREGVMAVISVKVPDPNYIGQGKDYLNMPAVASVLYGEVKEFIEDQFDKLPNEKENILNKVVQSCKVREAAHKAKEAARKNKTLGVGKVEGLTKCLSKKPHERCIWFVEGDSAGGSAKKARDKEVDAILPVFGKIPNVYDKTLDKTIASDKIMMIVKALECGIGDDFDIEKLAYGKVIILTDGDPDGEHIRCLYLTLFYKFLKPLIENGHLYIAQPPLFTIRKNPRTKKEENIYAWTKEEMMSICEGLTCKYEVQRNKGLGEMNSDELKDSTMDKDTRKLIQVTIDDIIEAEKALSVCMYDKDVANRKHFILANKPEGEIDEE